MEKKYFYGNEISEEGLERGYVDYQCLAKAFDAVSNDYILDVYRDDWKLVSGNEYDDDDEPKEFFQHFIVSNNAVEILKEADEVVYYNEKLDMYVWAVNHWGTAWSYVMTNIKITW